MVILPDKPSEEAQRRIEASFGPALDVAALLQGMAPLIENAQKTIEGLSVARQAAAESIASSLTSSIETAGSWLRTNSQFIETAIRSAELWRDLWYDTLPPNVADLSEDFIPIVEMSSGAGPCVMWAPRTGIVQELIAVDTFADRGAVLVAHRDEVLSDMLDTLGESASEVQAQRDLTIRAVKAAQDGHDAAAQALAAAALGSALHQALGYGGLGEAYKAMNAHDLEETGILRVRRVAIELATSRALVDTADHTEGFNRHGTLHGDPAYFGSGEMLAGLLLAVAWVRELSWAAEHEPQLA